MKSETKRKNSIYYFLIITAFTTYIVLTGAKNLYVAEKTTMYDLGIFGNLSALASTMEYYFYSYAVMQVLIIFFIRKVNVKWYLTITLGISAILSSLMYFTSTITSHYVIYTINGAMQAGVWGCTLKILCKYLPDKQLSVGSTLLNIGPAVAGLISYGTATLFGENWSLPFLILGIVLLISVICFNLAITLASKLPKEKLVVKVDAEKVSGKTVIPLSTKNNVVVFFVVSILLGGLITSMYFMLNNNLDVYLKQVGGFSNDTSKLLTILAPVCTIIGPIITTKLCDKFDFLKTATILFTLSLIFAVAVFFLYGNGAYLGLSLIVFFLIISNGARSISLSIAAVKVRDKIDTGVYATMVNSAASLTCGLAPKLGSLILDRQSFTTMQNWGTVFLIILLINALVVGILIAVLLLLKRKNRKLKNANA